MLLLVNVLWAGASLIAGRELFHFVRAPEVEETEPESKPETGPDDASEDPEADGNMGPEAVVVVPSTPAKIDELGNSLGLSIAAMGLSVVGAVFPVAKLLSYPLLLVSIAPVVRESWATVRETKKIDFIGLTAIGASLELALGYTTLAAFGWLVFTSGRTLQVRTRHQAALDLGSAFERLGESAWAIHNGVEVEIPIKDIEMSDRLIVRTGDPIPIDGVISEGVIAVDQRALTGESRLSELSVGDEVLASTIVLSGMAIITPLRTGSATVAARVEALLFESESFEQKLRARAAREAERSVRPTWAMMAVGLLSYGLPGVLAGFWTNCTDLSWFGAPYNVLNTIQAAARASILIKDGRSLEQLSQIDTIVFDKTGTLTLDTFEVVHVHAYAGLSEDEALAIAAALERRQQHPIARAITLAAERRELSIPATEELCSAIGYGMSARVAGREAMIGSARYMDNALVELGQDATEVSARATTAGHSIIYLALDGRCVGLIELAPQVRPEATELVDKLRARGLEVMMVTGDDEGPSAALALRLGIGRFHARALPEDKERIVAALQDQGRRVCFVGDGLNDGLALRRANVSISMTGASFVAVETAQILLQAGSLRELGTLFDLADDFSRDQRSIVGTSRFLTVASAGSLMLMSLNLSAIVWMYAAGFGFTVLSSSLPRMRDYASEHPEAEAHAVEHQLLMLEPAPAA